MKNVIFVIFAFLFSSMTLQSQDVVVLQSGEILEGKIIGVNYAGVHLKINSETTIYDKSLIESYKFRNNWHQVSGPTSDGNKNFLFSGMDPREKFERKINSAGTLITFGTVFSIGSLVAGILTEETFLMWVGGISLPLSYIISGIQLKSAAKQHKLIEF